MKKTILSIAILLLQVSIISATQKNWISINESLPVACNPTLLSSNSSVTEVEFNLPGFFTEERTTPRGQAFSISLPGAAKLLQTGMPDLPQLTFSLIIPDGQDMKAEIITSAFTDYNYSIAPSKGNLKRDIDPSSVPYTYSANYSVNAFFPAEQTTMRQPYILRDFRGQTVVVNPFAYNPVTKTLRVYTSLKIRVSPSGVPASQNKFLRRQPMTKVDPVFASVYRNQFINSVNNYTPLYERGNMLVIAATSLMTSVQPLVDWKNRIGQPTVLVDIATIGTNPTDIKSYIENYYNTNGLTFVLLVGDGPQIPPFPSQYGDSDPSYGYILGNDSYAEVIVGRFSANDPAELITQVNRSIDYERNPNPVGQWYHKGVSIGSDQGPGDDNEMDFEHEQNMRTDLMAYTYTTVDELFDGSQGGADASGDPDPTDLNNALNDGRSIITYTGHGSSSSLGTTGYSSTDVSSLTNYDELPFIFSVACVNGDFNSGTCLAEALMRSTGLNGIKATGAVATLMSTINQSWDPPMDGQDEMVDILVESYPGNIKHTFGGISVNGCMHMNDQYGTAGDEMTDTWTIFGDPSLMVRTNTPSPLAVSHAPVIDVNAITFPVTCTQNGAQVCLSFNNQIISVGWSLVGNAFLNNISGLQVGDTLDLTVTAYNSIPYTGQVIVTASTTGIQNINSKPFAIYPNPSHGSLFVNLAAGRENVSLSIVDAEGRVVMNKSVQEGKIDISFLPAGIYSAILNDANGAIGVERLVLNKD